MRYPLASTPDSALLPHQVTMEEEDDALLYIYFEMITIIRLADISIPSHSYYLCVCACGENTEDPLAYQFSNSQHSTVN